MHNPVGVELPELLENFEFLDDWMERYRYIIELGKRLPEMPEALRTPENKVLGCQSQVWLVVAESDDPERIVFYDENPPQGDARLQAAAARYKGKRLPLLDEVQIAIIEEQQPRWLSFLNRSHSAMTAAR